MTKQNKTYRMTTEAVELLKRLAEVKGISPTATLEILIRDAAKKQGFPQTENK